MSTEQQQQQHADEIPAGFYKGRGIAGSEQFGTTTNGNEQIGVDLQLVDLNRTVTTILIFTDKSEKFSMDRLRALGWKGGDSLAGIDTNEVQVQIKYDVYNDENGNPKRQMKAEIVTGGGRFVFNNPMDDTSKRSFFQRLNAIANAAPATPRPPAPGQTAQGYPADWDKAAPPANAQRPRVNL